MPDIKFSCPHCQQHIEADASYGGVQINCPSCNGGLVIPGTAAPPAPPPPTSAPSASTPVSLQRQVPAAGGACPSCGAGLGRGAVLCTQCGYNLATGQRTVAGRPAALGKPSKPQYETPWYQTPYPYVGAVFAVLAVLYFLGRDNDIMKAAFFGVAVLYMLGVHILVVVAAFRDNIGTGFLTLCLPFYALYFVYKVHENDTLKVLYTSAILINVALRFIHPE